MTTPRFDLNAATWWRPFRPLTPNLTSMTRNPPLQVDVWYKYLKVEYFWDIADISKTMGWLTNPKNILPPAASFLWWSRFIMKCEKIHHSIHHTVNHFWTVFVFYPMHMSIRFLWYARPPHFLLCSILHNNTCGNLERKRFDSILSVTYSLIPLGFELVKSSMCASMHTWISRCLISIPLTPDSSAF